MGFGHSLQKCSWGSTQISFLIAFCYSDEKSWPHSLCGFETVIIVVWQEVSKFCYHSYQVLYVREPFFNNLILAFYEELCPYYSFDLQLLLLYFNMAWQNDMFDVELKAFLEPTGVMICPIPLNILFYNTL